MLKSLVKPTQCSNSFVSLLQ